MSPNSLKVMRAITKSNYDSEQIFIQVWDMENEIGKEIEINLRFLKLNGLSQVNINNNLFLCGWGSDKSSDHAGSIFLKIDPMKQPANVSYLVSSSYCHFYPSLIQYKGEYIICVGGKNSVKCEIFSLTQAQMKWKALPDLPEERFKCILASDELNSCIYLFGGHNSNSNKIHSSILKLNLKNGPRWETIVVNTDQAQMLTKVDACICRVDRNTILIVGGTTNEEQESEDVIECSFNLKSGLNIRNKLKMNKSTKFETLKHAGEFNGNYFLIDETSSVHKIAAFDQKHSYKSFFSNDDDLPVYQ
jgi:hypothetical protein